MMRGVIRIAYYTDATVLGGAELSLGNLLAALSPRVDATVVGTDERIVRRLASIRPGAGTVVLPPIRRFSSLASLRAHVRAFRRLRPDIVQVNVNVCGASPWATLAALVTPRARVIAVEHLPHAILTRRRRVITRLTSRLLAAHVAVGDRAADEIARFIGVPRSSLRVIRNGVAEVSAGTARGGTARPVIGSIGRLDRQKGYDVLVRALPDLPGATVVIVGAGEEQARLEALAAELGVSDRLELAGWSDDARSRLGTFDVFVLPSRFEGLPLVILEAMLAGLPVVATDVGSVSEAVIDRSTGLLVPSGDPAALARALESLLGDAVLRDELGARGRIRARELFYAEGMAERYETLYDEVLS